MNQNFNLLIHIGYPKTASTWLQKFLFNNEDIGFISPWGNPSIDAIEKFVIINPFRFDPEETYHFFECGLKLAGQKKLIPVLSNETLSDNQVSGIYWGKPVAERLNSVFPTAKILIIIREQRSMIYSSYVQYLKSGGNQSLELYIGAVRQKSRFAPILQLDYLKYDFLLSYYYDLFGTKNILVLPLEMLKQNQTLFCEKIINFSGANVSSSYSLSNKPPQNISHRGVTINTLRTINSFIARDFNQSLAPLHWRFIWKLLTFLDEFIPVNFHLEQETQMKDLINSFVGNEFSESNQKTSQLIDCDLKSFGYMC